MGKTNNEQEEQSGYSLYLSAAESALRLFKKYLDTPELVDKEAFKIAETVFKSGKSMMQIQNSRMNQETQAKKFHYTIFKDMADEQTKEKIRNAVSLNIDPDRIVKLLTD